MEEFTNSPKVATPPPSLSEHGVFTLDLSKKTLTLPVNHNVTGAVTSVVGAVTGGFSLSGFLKGAGGLVKRFGPVLPPPWNEVAVDTEMIVEKIANYVSSASAPASAPASLEPDLQSTEIKE